MVLGKSTYILRFKNGTSKEMLVQFSNDETVRANLTRIIPTAISQGFLPPSCSPDTVELDYKDNPLNLDLPMREQGVREYEVVVLRDLSSQIRVTVRYRADDCDPAMETIGVQPNVVLGDALADFSKKLRSEFTFYGRRIRKYDLRLGRRRLNLRKSLRSQAIKNDIEVTFKPRVWFEWPPRFAWPPPPITAYLLSTVVVAAVVFLVIWFTRAPEPIPVTVRCPSSVRCNIYDAGRILLSDDNIYRFSMELGDTASFWIYPDSFPIFDTTFVLTDAYKKVDSVLISLDPALRYRDQPMVATFVSGWNAEQSNVRLSDALRDMGLDKQEIQLVINGFPHRMSNAAMCLHSTSLTRGVYELKLSLPDRDFRRIEFGVSSGDGQDHFLVDLADTTRFSEQAVLRFLYSLGH